MFIRKRRGWEIPESQVTPETAMLARRGLLAGLGAAAGASITPAHAQWKLFGSGPAAPAQALKALEAKHNARYEPGRAVNAEKDATTYNNYYEFSESKNLVDRAQALPLSPWTIEIAGLVKNPGKFDIDDLLKKMTLEERVYRHRCVETWAMTVPWIGFPLADLVKMVEPLGSAKYLSFTSLNDPKNMPGLRNGLYPWPYIEGLTVQEAMNELSLMTVGMYGKSAPPQNGAPIRLTTPWKYGFKQSKAVVKIEFTEKRPVGFWEKLIPEEYGFWANVNPDVSHPRWSQARERLLGTDEMVATKIWNGYGEFVAGMYADKTKERLFA